MSGSDTADLQIRAPSRKRSWVRWALVGLVIAGVVGAGLSPRAAGIMPGIRGIDMFADYPLLEDAGLIRLKPSYSGRVWGLPFRTNSYGFRSPPISEKPEPNELRVALLGSCITLGVHDLSRNGYEVGPSTLQARLQEHYPDLRISIINAGVPGSFELQHLLHYNSIIKDLDPSWIELMQGLPDPLSGAQRWALFRYNYDLIERINRIEAEAHGVRYLDLMACPELRDRKDYHGYEYYLL